MKYLKWLDIFITILISLRVAPAKIDPCAGNVCGPHAICRNSNDQAICSCLPDYFGNPPNCRPECVYNSDCPLDKSCNNNHCVDPCLQNVCGINANCRAIQHSPICSCKDSYVGDPFTRCYLPTPSKKFSNISNGVLLFFLNSNPPIIV